MDASHSTRIDADTKQETILSLSRDFPYFCGLCDLYEFPGSHYPWHWHGEVEFFHMRQGALEYHTPGATEVFRQGEVGFVNAGVPHMTMAHDSRACVQEEHIFCPSLVAGQPGSAIERRYVLPVIRSRRMDMLRLTPENPFHGPMLALMRQCFELNRERPEGYELEIRGRLGRLWLHLFQSTAGKHDADAHMDQQEARLKAMLSHIAAHYAEPMTLEQIASAAYVSPRECLRVFRRALNTTPIEYLTAYRIAKAREYLLNTKHTVSDISAACGFSCCSYFGKVFRRHVGCTPLSYRAQKRSMG